MQCLRIAHIWILSTLTLLSTNGIDQQKTDVSIWTEVNVHVLYFLAQTQVSEQCDNEHDFQCSVYSHSQLNFVPNLSLSDVLYEIIFWKVELHINYGIIHPAQCGSKLM